MSESISYTVDAYTNWITTGQGKIQIGHGSNNYETRLKFSPQKELRSITIHVELDALDGMESVMQQADLYAAIITSSAVQEPTSQKTWHWKSGTKQQQSSRAWGEVTIEGSFHAGTTYYLWLWGDYAPGGVQAAAYNNFAYNNAWTTMAGELAGLARVDNGTAWSDYMIYIDDGESFEPYIPYVDNGSGWEVLT